MTMNIVVLLKMVPDVVEELEIDAGGTALDMDAARMILSESDDHSLEQAILIKEHSGGRVTAMALDQPEVDSALFAALAKGADRAIKITGLDAAVSTRQASVVFSRILATQPERADLILTGVQAIDDLDGLMAPLVAHELGLPTLGIVTGLAVDPATHTAKAIKEYHGGIRGEFEVGLPAVLGIQASEKPPRYVPVSKLRAIMKSQHIETIEAAPPAEEIPALRILAMKKPEATTQAEFLEGSVEAVADRLCEVLAGRGLV